MSGPATAGSWRGDASTLELRSRPRADRAAAAGARARAERPHRRDRRRQEPADRRAGAGARRARRHDAGAPRGRRRARGGAVRSAAGAADRVARGERGGRSTARLDDQAVTAARLAETVGPLVEIHGQHEQSRLLDERWQRELLDAFGEHAELRPDDGAGRGALAREPSGARGGRRSSRARWSGGSSCLRHEVEEIGGARLRAGEAAELRERLDLARHGEAIARGAAAIRAALDGEGSGAREALAGGVSEARAAGPRRPSLRGGRGAARRPRGRARGRGRGGAPARRGRRPRRARRCSPPRSACRRSTRWSAATATTRPRSSPTASARPRRSSGSRGWTASASGARPTTRGSSPRSRWPRRACRRAGGPRRGTPRVRRGRGAAQPRIPGRRVRRRGRAARGGPDEPAIELDGDAVAFDATGADEVVFRFAPNPGEPPRSLAKIASGGELSPRRAGDQAGARGGRRHADAGLRRGRRRHRRPHRRPGRTQPVGARAQPPGARASPTCRRSRPMPTPTSGSPSASATAGRSPRSSASTARARSSSWRRCSAADPIPASEARDEGRPRRGRAGHDRRRR